MIGAALSILQNNKQGQEDRKKQMEAAAMGQFAGAPAPGGQGQALAGLGNAIGGMLGGDKQQQQQQPASAAMAPGVQSTGGPMSGDPADDDLREKLGMSLLA